MILIGNHPSLEVLMTNQTYKYSAKHACDFSFSYITSRTVQFSIKIIAYERRYSNMSFSHAFVFTNFI